MREVPRFLGQKSNVTLEHVDQELINVYFGDQSSLPWLTMVSSVSPECEAAQELQSSVHQNEQLMHI